MQEARMDDDFQLSDEPEEGAGSANSTRRKLCQELKGPTPRGFLQMRVELTELQSQLRLQEMQRQVEKDKAAALLAKQKKQIAVLESEKSSLLNNLKALRRRSKIRRDRSPQSIQQRKLIEKIGELLQRLSELEKLNANEREKCDVLNEKIKIVDENILEENKMWLRSKTSREFQSEEKRLEVYEKRREHATVLYDKLLSSNVVIRERIDQVLKDRERFSSVYRNLEKTLAAKKKETKTLITKATTAYEQKDAILLKLKEYRDELEQDETSHRNQIRLLKRQKEREKQLDRFVEDKLKPRSTASSDNRVTSACLLRRDSLQVEIPQRRLSERTLASYREVFQRLQQVFFCQIEGFETVETNGEKSPENLSGRVESDKVAGYDPGSFDRLVDNFIQEEERSFALFAFVSQASDSLERLQQQIDSASSRLQLLHEQELTTARRNQTRLQALRDDLKSMLEESRLLERKTANCDDSLRAAVTAIGQLIKLAHFDQIGDIKAEMDDGDVVANLSALEERVARIALICDALHDMPPQSMDEIKEDAKQDF